MESDSSPVISCRNVWKLFGPSPGQYFRNLDQDRSFEEIQRDGYIAAVRNATVDISRGEMLVVMGLSGSGKSTLVRCLSRLIDVTGGEITVEGMDLMSLSEKELIGLRRSKMGMVFQSFGLLPHRTVLNNVAFPLEMRGQDRYERRNRALEMIELVGLAGREDYYPRELSGGQQQRVGIARSLAIEPDIWFLDEPFSALDPLIRREMQDEFLRLQGMLRKTIVFITHDFSEALRLADRIAIMKDGEIQQCDTPGQIVLHPATDYVAKFTEDVEKSRVVHARLMALPIDGTVPDGATVPANAVLHDVARQVVEDSREQIPVAEEDGSLVGLLDRREALVVLYGDEK